MHDLRNCGQHLAFENSVCPSGGSVLGFFLDDTALLTMTSGEESEHGRRGRLPPVSIVCQSPFGRMQLVVKVNPGRGAGAELCTDAEGGNGRVTMEAVTDRAIVTSATVRQPLTCRHPAGKKGPNA